MFISYDMLCVHQIKLINPVSFDWKDVCEALTVLRNRNVTNTANFKKTFKPYHMHRHV